MEFFAKGRFVDPCRRSHSQTWNSVSIQHNEGRLTTSSLALFVPDPTILPTAASHHLVYPLFEGREKGNRTLTTGQEKGEDLKSPRPANAGADWNLPKQ